MQNDMRVFSINDIVTCKTRDGYIVGRSDKVFDDTISLKIIGAKYMDLEADEYVVYVPEYDLSRLKTRSKVTGFMCSEFDIEKRFVGDNMTFIRASHVFEINYHADGETCNRCDDFFEMAETSAKDGSFTCYSCRQNPWR